MKQQKVIQIPDNKSTSEVINFLFNAGFKAKDYDIIKIGNHNYIKPKVQIIIARDGVEFGFKIVEI